VEALHREFPQLTYDVTIKVEHLRENADLLRTLRDTGCLFIVSAVESLDDSILEKLQKGHTREDFFGVVEDCRSAGLILEPTFVPFTPWTTFENYLDLLEQLQRLELIGAVAPIQLAIRLLVTAGSRLLELEELRRQVGGFDAKSLTYPWRHRDPAIDRLCEKLQDIVASAENAKESRATIFEKIWNAANRQTARKSVTLPATSAAVPYLNEPWYC
jgi:radical SAM superfamily enzyme YgiQ (UPF0313 family)